MAETVPHPVRRSRGAARFCKDGEMVMNGTFRTFLDSDLRNRDLAFSQPSTRCVELHCIQLNVGKE